MALSPTIEEIYRTGFTLAADGTSIRLGSAISRQECQFIEALIRESSGTTRTLEVGCAQGLSSLVICDSIKSRPGAHHYIIDPFQKTDWRGAGIAALKRAGFEHFTLVEQRSEIALPNLLQDHEGSFDLILVDGWHTFDHTLLDCFYSIRLLKVGGYLVVDDCNMPPIAKVIRYLSKYPFLETADRITDYPSHKFKHVICRIAAVFPIPMDLRARLPKPLQRRVTQVFRRPSMVCLKKTSADDREWNWYRAF